MHAGLALALLRLKHKGGVVHAERIENVLAKIDVQRFAAGRFDDAADPIDAGAVLPMRAGIEHQRSGGANFLCAVGNSSSDLA